MRFADSEMGTAGSQGTAMRTVAAFGVTLVLLLVGCAGAAGATRARSSAPTGGSLCLAARGVAKTLIALTSITQITAESPSALKTDYRQIRAAEPALTAASASPKIKTDVRTVLGFVNLAATDLAKVKWNIDGLLPYVGTLIPAANRTETPVKALRTYLRGTCELAI
jgi:hypothetical protein